jgi:hypothetical protein
VLQDRNHQRELKRLLLELSLMRLWHKRSSLLLVNGTNLRMELIALPSKAHVWKDQDLKSQFKLAVQSELQLNLIDLIKLQKSKHLKMASISLTKEKVLLVARRLSLLTMTEWLNQPEINFQPNSMNLHHLLHKHLLSLTVNGINLKMDLNASQSKTLAMILLNQNQAWMTVLLDLTITAPIEIELRTLIDQQRPQFQKVLQVA